jgi:hypothetical protein
MTFTSREVGGGQTSKTEWVLLEDYELLKAEVERLRASSFVTAVPVEQYERVIKAGDDMAFHYQELVRIEWGHMTTHIAPSIVRWNAAKEGKGQP